MLSQAIPPFLRTDCFGTHVGLSPLLILSISSARSLVHVPPSWCPTGSFSGWGEGIQFGLSTGPSQNSVLMLSSESFRILDSSRTVFDDGDASKKLLSGFWTMGILNDFQASSYLEGYFAIGRKAKKVGGVELETLAILGTGSCGVKFDIYAVISARP